MVNWIFSGIGLGCMVIGAILKSEMIELFYFLFPLGFIIMMIGVFRNNN